VLRGTILQRAVADSHRGRIAALQIAVVEGGPRLGDLEAGAVAALSSTGFSIVSGGLACIAGALALGALLPGFSRDAAGAPAAETPAATGRLGPRQPAPIRKTP
jgi:hypothetical protein